MERSVRRSLEFTLTRYSIRQLMSTFRLGQSFGVFRPGTLSSLVRRPYLVLGDILAPVSKFCFNTCHMVSLLLRLSVSILALAIAAEAQNTVIDHFEKKIRPVLAARCYSCHSASAVTPQGGLLLDSTQGIRRGGNSGPAIQPGDPEHSLLVRAIRHTDNKLKMPPGDPLSPEIVAEFELWIRAGALLPVEQASVEKKQSLLWSLQKPRMPALPIVKTKGWTRNDIDLFILNRLEARELAPSPEAEKRTLIRRATYDLTGLPPSAEEVEQFVDDTSPQAYDRLIDRLLASPRYGERWARHWLDVARYADSFNDPVNTGQHYPWSYTYRDWVIRALNEDLPYDQFVLFQLAADRLPNVEPRHLAALGFLSLGRNFPNGYPETVDDRIDAVSRGLLGLTVACARCHDHKYDPIPTKDYYSFYSVLSNIREPDTLPLIGKPVKPLPSRHSTKIDSIRFKTSIRSIDTVGIWRCWLSLRRKSPII